MNRQRFALALAAALALAVHGQVAPPLDDSEIVVATVNGDAITKAQLEENWRRLASTVRSQYEQSAGGKAGLLETMILKRLVVQEALKAGLDKRQEAIDAADAARELVLFDLFVREVVAARVITDQAMRAYFDEHPDEFRKPELAKLRIIAVSSQGRTPDEARVIASRIMTELFALKGEIAKSGDASMAVEAFGGAAAAYSEHESAETGGNLGWIDPNMLEPQLAEAAQRLPPGAVSGLIETSSGFALLLVEGRQPAALATFEEARPLVRQKLLARSGRELMEATTRLTRELRSSANVHVLLENLQ